jgi:hypothetical protein
MVVSIRFTTVVNPDVVGVVPDVGIQEIKNTLEIKDIVIAININF